MTKKRANYRMVAEDDPQFARFWDIYPRRVAKKEARKTWAQINPSPELVDRIIAALEWQVPAFQWDGPKQDYAPYPASYLNAERWTDERRQTPRPQAGQAAMGVLETLLGDGANGRHTGPGDGNRNAR
jgi:hypothetical protein